MVDAYERGAPRSRRGHQGGRRLQERCFKAAGGTQGDAAPRRRTIAPSRPRNHVFHRLIVEASGNSVLLRLWDRWRSSATRISLNHPDAVPFARRNRTSRSSTHSKPATAKRRPSCSASTAAHLRQAVHHNGKRSSGPPLLSSRPALSAGESNAQKLTAVPASRSARSGVVEASRFVDDPRQAAAGDVGAARSAKCARRGPKRSARPRTPRPAATTMVVSMRHTCATAATTPNISTAGGKSTSGRSPHSTTSACIWISMRLTPTNAHREGVVVERSGPRGYREPNAAPDDRQEHRLRQRPPDRRRSAGSGGNSSGSSGRVGHDAETARGGESIFLV